MSFLVTEALHPQMTSRSTTLEYLPAKIKPKMPPSLQPSTEYLENPINQSHSTRCNKQIWVFYQGFTRMIEFTGMFTKWFLLFLRICKTRKTVTQKKHLGEVFLLFWMFYKLKRAIRIAQWTFLWSLSFSSVWKPRWNVSLFLPNQRSLMTYAILRNLLI